MMINNVIVRVVWSVVLFGIKYKSDKVHKGWIYILEM